MGRTNDWIGNYCKAGNDFSDITHRSSSPHFDDIVFCSRDYGNNNNDGSSWAQAVKDINTACDKLKYATYGGDARGRHQAILFQGRLTSSNAFTELQVIDIPGVSLIGGGGAYGMGGGWDSVFVSPNTCDSGGGSYGEYAGLALAADDLEVCGIKFYTDTAAQAQWYILLEDALTPGDGRNTWIHDNVLQGASAGTASRTSGILTRGIESALIERNFFYYCEYGIQVSTGGVRYPNKLAIKDNWIFAPSTGILISDNYCCESLFQGNRIIPKNMYGYTFVVGINATANARGNLFVDNIVAHATEGNAFTYGTNFWINNYYSGSGGTLAVP